MGKETIVAGGCCCCCCVGVPLTILFGVWVDQCVVMRDAMFVAMTHLEVLDREGPPPHKIIVGMSSGICGEEMENFNNLERRGQKTAAPGGVWGACPQQYGYDVTVMMGEYRESKSNALGEFRLDGGELRELHQLLRSPDGPDVIKLEAAFGVKTGKVFGRSVFLNNFIQEQMCVSGLDFVGGKVTSTVVKAAYRAAPDKAKTEIFQAVLQGLADEGWSTATDHAQERASIIEKISTTFEFCLADISSGTNVAQYRGHISLCVDAKHCVSDL